VDRCKSWNSIVFGLVAMNTTRWRLAGGCASTVRKLGNITCSYFAGSVINTNPITRHGFARLVPFLCKRDRKRGGIGNAIKGLKKIMSANEQAVQVVGCQVECAWCGAVLVAVPGCPPERVSHGICKDCKIDWLAGLGANMVGDFGD